jgi:hypothetical protein
MPTLFLQREGLNKYYDLISIFFQKIVINQFIDNKTLSFLERDLEGIKII